jgi:long-chain acyl-CoA synthetase
VPRSGQTVTPEEIITHCRGLIAGYKCPRDVTVRNEPMPLSGAGKILKSALREPFWAGRAKRVN